MGWAAVLGLGEPVVGRVEDYESARGELSSLASAAEEVKAQFARVEAGAVAELQGEGAKELAALIGGVDDCLRDLPAVLSDTSGIFTRHAQDLDALKRRADEALARAETRWDTWQHAERAESRAEARLASLTSQLRRADVSGDDPGAAAAAASLASAVSSQRARVAACRRATGAAYDELQQSRSEHESLQDDEQALVDRTVGALRGVDLRSLENPGFFDKLGGWALDALAGILDWVADGIADIAKFAQAAMDGDFGAALWHLRDFLDKFTLVVLVVGIAAMCLVSGGAALPLALVVGSVIASGLQFVSGVSLGLMGTPHPETGERIGMLDVVLDFVLMVPALKGSAKTVRTILAGRKHPRTLRPGTFDADRKFRPYLVNRRLERRAEAGRAGLFGDGRVSGAARDNRLRRVRTEMSVQEPELKGVTEMAFDSAAESAFERPVRSAADGAAQLVEDAVRGAPGSGDHPGQAAAAGTAAPHRDGGTWPRDPAAAAAEQPSSAAAASGQQRPGSMSRPRHPRAPAAAGWALDFDGDAAARLAGCRGGLWEFFAGECGQITSLDEHHRSGVSLQDGRACYQLAPA